MISQSLEREMPTLKAEPKESHGLDAIFDAHLAREFADRNVDAEGFRRATSDLAPDHAVAPAEPPAIAVWNVFELASDYGIRFG